MSGVELHPFDPLTTSEIEATISIVREAYGQLFFNVVTLHEPRKAEMTRWLANPTSVPKPVRVADVVVIAPGGKVYDGLVDLQSGKITKWELLDGLQPIVSVCTANHGEFELTTSIDHHGGAYRS